MIDYTCDICSIQIDTILWCTYYTYYTYIYIHMQHLYMSKLLFRLAHSLIGIIKAFSLVF